MSGSHTQPATEQKRRVRIGLKASLLFHVCLLTVLAVWYVRRSANDDDVQKRPPPAPSSSVKRDPPDTKMALVAKPGETAAEAVGNKLDEVIARSEELTEEENRDRLDGELQKLDKISSEESIDQLTGRFFEWVGTQERAVGLPDSSPSGQFDPDTAQVHDVLRRRGPDGRWQYRSVLIDAAGLTMEVDVGEAEGQSTYRTMQRLKSSPLAEKVYRRITMPLMDKLLAAQRHLDKAARIAPTVPADAGSAEPTAAVPQGVEK